MEDKPGCEKAGMPSETMERVETGISGLDELLQGGIPSKRHVAVYGGPGTGKTSLAFEFIYHGAERGERGVFISFEEDPGDIIENMKNTFPGMDNVDRYVEEKKMEIIKPPKLELEDIMEFLKNRIKENKVSRLAIDSATMIKMSFDNSLEYRRSLFSFLAFMRKQNMTSMMIVESPNSDKEKIMYDVEHFIMDGIINLYTLSRGERSVRSVEVFKMRGTDHSRELVPLKVEGKGIKIYVGERVF